MRDLVRNTIVTLLVAYSLFSVYAAAASLWEPQGGLGLSTDYGARVRGVAPGSPAGLAGIVAGDEILLSSVPILDRRYVTGANSSVPVGTRVAFRLSHRGATRELRLTAVRTTLTGADRSALLLQCAASLVFIAVGTSLILIRPNAATWGFGLYCLLVLPTAAYPSWLPVSTATLVGLGFYDIVQNAGVIGLLVFVLHFPRPFDTAWRRRIRGMLPAIFVVLAAMTLYPDVANLLFGNGASVENHVLQLAFGTTFATTIVILFDTYGRITADERERVRWVLIGFCLGLMTSYVGSTLLFSSLLPFNPPAWVANALVSLNVLLPLTVAHAVVRHRVFDINFVIGRALVYGALTTILAALFGFLDWLFGYELEDFRLSHVVEAGISICIAFAFDSLHKRIERFIEAVFFRKRHAAEARLDRLIRELPQARSGHVVESAVIDEVVDAFELTSAALYLVGADGVFKQTAARGWEESTIPSLGDDDLLVLSLRAQRRSIELAELPWHHAGLPQNDFAPVVAVPMSSRADLSGILLYGGHPGGADVDPAELAQLERLAHAASVALDELEAERLRATSSQQTTTIAKLEARLDELRRFVPGAGA